MKKLPDIRKANIKGKTVLLRAELNVPLKKGADKLFIEDDFRVSQTIETLRFLSSAGAKTIVCAHLGRPKGWQEEYSLRPVADEISDRMTMKLVPIKESDAKLPHYDIPHIFFFEEDFRKENNTKNLKDLNEGDIALLENIRFYPEEKKGDQNFAEALAGLADIYVDDAFSVSHREDASVTIVPQILPHYAGPSFVKEYEAMSAVLDGAKKPVILMIGGIKVVDKLSGLTGLIERCDQVIVGGGLATLFFKAMGYEIGKSVFDEKNLATAKDLLRNYKNKLHLPLDVIVARSPEKPDSVMVRKPDQVLPHEMILDIGTDTIMEYSNILRTGKTLIWSGPMGYFEVSTFSHGTKALGQVFSSRAGGEAYGIVGGGNTVSALRLMKMQEYVDHVSSSGSAMLKFLAGEEMPGLQALMK